MFSANSNTISQIQLVTGIAAVIGFFFINVSLINLLILILSFYVYSIIGISLMLHRYYTHKSFEFRFKFIKFLFTFIAILSGRGSPIGWVYVHRLHHAYADSENDPHSPKRLGFKLFGFSHIETHTKKMNFFLVKDLMTKFHLKINEYYFLIIISYVFIIGFISFEFLYFSWILPVFLIQLSQNSFNYFAHLKGYRNFETRDNSTNNPWLFPFIWGDAWHNNHHQNPSLVSTKVKKYEFDPITILINMVKK